MNLDQYNFADPLIRNLVHQNHCPTERVQRSSTTVTIKVICMQDDHAWPCPIITALREWETSAPADPEPAAS